MRVFSTAGGLRATSEIWRRCRIPAAAGALPGTAAHATDAPDRHGPWTGWQG